MTTMPPAALGPRAVVLVVTVATLAPLAVYFALRPFTSDAVALACSAAIPASGTLIAAATRRRTGPLALLAFVAFGAALAATVLEGGDTLPLKLYRPIATGVFGLACLISLPVRRPLLLALAARASRVDARVGHVAARTLRSAAGRRRLETLTLVVGLVAVTEAIATTTLALALPTGTFLLVSRLTRWAILGLGVLVVAVLVRRRGDPVERQPTRRTGTRAADPENRRPWFRSRGYGIGVMPQTWQGWLVIALAAAAVVAGRLLLRS